MLNKPVSYFVNWISAKSYFMQVLPLLLLTHFIALAGNGACTAFSLRTDNSLLAGKNLDWLVGEGVLFVNKRDVPKISFVPPGEKAARWTSKFGSVTFNQFGIEFPLGGMNEAGLVVEELSCWPSGYPRDQNRECINELQWIQYQLDNYRTVEEVISNLSNPGIRRYLFALHYFIADRSGRSAVIEFISGGTKVYSGGDLPVPALSNNSYENSIENLSRYEGFGGELEIRNGPGSQERFMRAAWLLKQFVYSDQKAAVNYAFRMLENVRQADTQWRIVYDPDEMHIYLVTLGNDTRRNVDLNAADFSADKPAAMLNILRRCESRVLNDCFSEFSADENRVLLQSVFGKLVEGGELERGEADSLKTGLLEYQTGILPAKPHKGEIDQK